MRARAAAAAAAGLLAVAPPGGSPGGVAGVPVGPFGAIRPASAQPAPAAAPAPAGTPAPPLNVDQLVALNLQQDRDTLLRGRAQPDQDEAARRLVARQTPEARGILLDALRQADNPPAQAAAARAVADDPAPDPRTIDPLYRLLAVERVTKAATAALLNPTLRGPLPNGGTGDGVDAILSFFDRNGGATQAAAVRALGGSTDHRVARLLAGWVRDPGNQVTRRNFAADALAEMTGLTENGRDPAAWAAWWQANQGKAPDQFRAELLERNRRRPAPLTDADGLVGQLYQFAADADKPRALRRVLDSSDPAFRAAGARLTFRVFNDTGKMPGAVPRVRDLLRDSAPEVRAEAALTLGKLNDKPSLEAVLAQLRVEPDTGIRVALMQAVVPMQDARAVPELVRLLAGDPSVRMATVAAETLAKIGPEVAKDPALAANTADSLLRAMGRRAAQDPAGDLRGACVEALVPLRLPQYAPLYQQWMRDRNQPARVRKAALAGVGTLGNRDLANAVFDIARDDREDEAVRVEALGAMELLRDPGFANELFALSRQKGGNGVVQLAAAKTFERLLPLAAATQLDDWAAQLLNAGQFGPRVAILREKVGRLDRAQAPDPTGLAAALESLGDALARVGRPGEGAQHFQRALGIYAALQKAQPAGQDPYGPTVANLRRQVLTAQLAGEQYAEAVRFAQETVAAGASQADLLPPIVNEVDRLVDARQPERAVRLATEALKFPGLDERNRGRLTRGLNAAKAMPPAAPGQGPGPGR